jgi:ABC-type lipoprotein release transport system permease subunit
MLNGDQADPRGIYIQRSMAYVIPLVAAAGARVPQGSAAGGVGRQSEPAARAVRTLQQIYNESMAQTQFVLVILGIAASVTLLLGLVGIYGVIAYIVSQRRREVGIRMALGAQGESVQRIFVTRGLSLAAIGLALGLIGAGALMRLLSVATLRRESVRPDHLRRGLCRPGIVALIATWLPARQATRVDPMSALRAE